MPEKFQGPKFKSFLFSSVLALVPLQMTSLSGGIFTFITLERLLT